MMKMILRRKSETAARDHAGAVDLMLAVLLAAGTTVNALCLYAHL